MNLEELTAEVEAVSRIYATRHGIDRDPAWFVLKLQEEVGELTQAYLMRSGQARDKGHTADELESASAPSWPTSCARCCCSPGTTTSTWRPRSSRSGCAGTPTAPRSRPPAESRHPSLAPIRPHFVLPSRRTRRDRPPIRRATGTKWV